MISKLQRVSNPGLFLVKAPAKQPPLKERPGVAPDIPHHLHESVCTAIKLRQQVRFTYSDRPRIAEPHDYGIQNGQARLLAYQTGGESSAGRLPAWRWFDVSKISDFEVLDQTFPGNRPAPSGRHHHWDTLFIRVGEPE